MSMPGKFWAFPPDTFDNVSLWQDQPSPAKDAPEYTRSDLIPAMLAEARAEGIREAIEAVAQADSAELTMHGVTPTLMRLQALIAQEDRSDD